MGGLLTLLIPGVTTLLDKFIPDNKANQEAKAELERLKTQALVAEASSRSVESVSSIIKSEATSESAMARNWRPAAMWMFLILIANNFFVNPILILCGITPIFPAPSEQVWTLLTVGMGGYIVARSGEKIAGTVSLRKFLASLEKQKVPVSPTSLTAIEKALNDAQQKD